MKFNQVNVHAWINAFNAYLTTVEKIHRWLITSWSFTDWICLLLCVKHKAKSSVIAATVKKMKLWDCIMFITHYQRHQNQSVQTYSAVFLSSSDCLSQTESHHQESHCQESHCQESWPGVQ